MYIRRRETVRCYFERECENGQNGMFQLFTYKSFLRVTYILNNIMLSLPSGLTTEIISCDSHITCICSWEYV